MSGSSPTVVLGGSGFIGSRLAQRLAVGGSAVKAVSRRGGWPGGTPPAGVTLHAVDLAAPEAEARLAPLLAGCRIVVNCSGALLRPGVAASIYQDLHVSGTARVLAALEAVAGDAEIRRLVHVSTTGVLGPTGPDPLDESAPIRPSTIYERTKAEGERVALAGRRSGLEVVVARPGLVYGPGDHHLVALFTAVERGRFRPIGGIALWQPVFIDDLTAGLERLTEAKDVDGEIFHLAGAETVSVHHLAAAIASALGTRLRGPHLPRSLAWMAGAALEALCLPLGLEPPLSRMRVRTLTEHRRYDISRACRRLGWQPDVGLEQGLRRTIAWYRGESLLPPAPESP